MTRSMTDAVKSRADRELNDRELDGVVGGDGSLRQALTRLSQTANPPGGSGTEMNFGNGKDARELQDSELEAVSGGASMVEYTMISLTVLAIAVAKRLSS
jgi:hypothetical protein